MADKAEFYCLGLKKKVTVLVEEVYTTTTKGGGTRYQIAGTCTEGKKPYRVTKIVKEADAESFADSLGVTLRTETFSAEESTKFSCYCGTVCVCDCGCSDSSTTHPITGVITASICQCGESCPCDCECDGSQALEDFDDDTFIPSGVPDRILDADETPQEVDGSQLEEENATLTQEEQEVGESSESLIPLPSQSPEGDGPVLGQWSDDHSYSPLHAEVETSAYESFTLPHDMYKWFLNNPLSNRFDWEEGDSSGKSWQVWVADSDQTEFLELISEYYDPEEEVTHDEILSEISDAEGLSKTSNKRAGVAVAAAAIALGFIWWNANRK